MERLNKCIRTRLGVGRRSEDGRTSGRALRLSRLGIVIPSAGFSRFHSQEHALVGFGDGSRGGPAVVNIDRDSQPLEYLAPGVLERYAPAEMPSILAVTGAAKTNFKFVIHGASHRLSPLLKGRGHVVRMHDAGPAPAGSLFRGKAGEVIPVPVAISVAALGVGHPDHLRRKLDQ